MSATAAAPTTAAFSSALEEFFRAARRVRGRDSQAHADGLSLAQFQLLDVLGDGEPLTVSQLAAAGGVAQPTATRMLDALDRDGIVQRSAAVHDRRCVLVALTPAGGAALAAKRAQVQAARERLAASLTDRERQDAAALLRRLAALMEDL